MIGRIQVKNGLWYIVIPYKDEGGNYKQKWISTSLKERGNKKAVKKLLENELKKFEKEHELLQEKTIRRSKSKEIDKSKATMLFHEYILEYIEEIKPTLSLKVYYIYKETCNRKIKEYFNKNKLRLIDITTEDITGFYDFLRSKGLKNGTIKQYSSVIRPTLKKAYKEKLIPDNPYEFVPTIKKERSHMTFYDKEEIEKFFNVIKGHKYELLFKIAVYYGLRRSELLGLRWNSIDFHHKTININHKVMLIKKNVYCSDVLKTKTSYRTLPLLPIIENELIRRKENIENNITFYGNTYNKKYLDYIFVEPDGRITYPDHVTHVFRKILKENNLKHIRFHDLRHSCASLLLANGVQMKQIQEWLGHSNFSTTADVYSHLDFSSKINTASTIATALINDKDKKQNKELENLNSIKLMMNEMKKLGIKDIEEYYEYLNSHDSDKDLGMDLEL